MVRLRAYGGATGAVSRWLFKADPDYGLRAAWERMSLDTLERFTRDAKAWLSDRSELATKTIERANYAELLAYYRKLKGLPSLEEPAPAPKTVAIPGLGRSITITPQPPAPKIPKGVHRMREGFPEGRYAVEIDGEVHCFWFKYHRTGAKLGQEETLYRKDGKWVSIMRYVPEWKRAVEIIKSDSYTQAVLYGARTGHCSACGRPLARADSLKRGTGDTCAMQEIHKASLETALKEDDGEL